MLSLSRLGRREGIALVERLAGDALPADIVEESIQRTDGVPLFLEPNVMTATNSLST